MAPRDEKTLTECYTQAAKYIGFGYESIDFGLKIGIDRSATITRRVLVKAEGEVKQLDQYLMVPVLRKPDQPDAMKITLTKPHRKIATVNPREVLSKDGKKRILVLDIDPPLLKGNQLEYEIVESMIPDSLALLKNELENGETENKFSFEVSWPTKHLCIQVILPQLFAPIRSTSDVWRGQTRITVDEVARDMRDNLQEDEEYEKDGQKYYRLWLDVQHPTQGFVYALKWEPPIQALSHPVAIPTTSTTFPQLSQEVSWLHLSDLHYREAEDYDIKIVKESLVEDIKKCIDQYGLKPDFIVFSGDLAFSAQASQYYWAEQYLDELLKITNLPDRNRMLVVPGNHDIDWTNIDPIVAAGIRSVLNSRDAVQNLLRPDRDRTHLFAKFGQYRAFFNRYFKDIARFDDEQYFWSRRLNLATTTVGILGLNSSWMSGVYRNQQDKVDDYGKLIVGERQVDEAIKQLNESGDTDVRIALMHHPFGALNADMEEERVQRLLKKHCSFILHGHLHEPDVIRAASLAGENIIIPAGACYNRRDRANGYNFVRYSLASGDGAVFLRRYSDRRREWIADMDATGEDSRGQTGFQLPPPDQSRK